jgi:hypothetical protein
LFIGFWSGFFSDFAAAGGVFGVLAGLGVESAQAAVLAMSAIDAASAERRIFMRNPSWFCLYMPSLPVRLK